MNPFDLRGPEFLLFYLALGFVVTAGVWLRRRALEPGGPPEGDLTDPYLIACLRGGPNEALRVATFTLLDRGLLRAEETRLAATRPDAAALVKKPLEKLLLKEFAKPREASEMFRAPSLIEAGRDLERSLIDAGLLPGPRTKAARWLAAIFGMVLVLGAAGIKIGVALSRGRTNVVFLVLLAIGFLLLLLRLASPRRTPRGAHALEDLENLFAGRRALALSGGSHIGDLALLTGVFGLAAASGHPTSAKARKLFPHAANEGGSASSWASCGASSCGSSCGGGGGGGCGGCGGGG